jgi:large subunit ribosomal protein L24
MSSSARVRLSTILSQARKQKLQQRKRNNVYGGGNGGGGDGDGGRVLHQRFNIVRGDKVQVIGQHPEAGKQGVVQQVLRHSNRVIVEGVNVRTKHVKGNPDRGISGRSVQQEFSIPYPNVNLLDPVTNQPTRIYRTFLEDGTKVRVAKKSGAVIPRPEALTFRKRPINSVVTTSDTSSPEDVWGITYDKYVGTTSSSSNERSSA